MSDRVVQMHYGVMHPMFREQLHAVPDGFRYDSRHPALHAETGAPKRVVQQAGRVPALRRLGERLALRALSRSGYVHRTRVRPISGAVLIHSCERLLYRSPLPYVLDFEHASLFVLYQGVALSRPWARRLLLNALGDEPLRFLLPWTESARQSLSAALGPDAETRLGSRIQTVYPAIRLAVDRPHTRHGGPLRLVFVSTGFYEKGAVEAIAATHRLAATHDVHLDVLSYAPPDWRKRLAGDPVVTLHTPGPRVDVRALYAQADVLLFPSHMDTLGFVVLEAMAHGLPVLAPRHLAFTELIDDGGSGLLFAPENQILAEDTTFRFPHSLPPPRRFMRALQAPSDRYIDGIASALARIAEDHDVYDRLAEGAFERVRSGRLSVERRRAALSRIYTAALT